MAQRRMFSNRIANSAKFLQMPAESRLLYFHMILRADDDGVVESYPLIKMLGVAPDVFKVLIAKSFVRELNEDQVVVITDWHEHNVIRADRKIDSIYLPLLFYKCPELPILEPKPRSDVKDNSKRLGGQSTDGLSKVKLSKDKLSIADKSAQHSLLVEIVDYFSSKVVSLKGYKPEINWGRAIKLLKPRFQTYGAEKCRAIIDFFVESKKFDELGGTISVCFSEHTINAFLAKEQKEAWKY